jgi:hypothetical protein
MGLNRQGRQDHETRPEPSSTHPQGTLVSEQTIRLAPFALFAVEFDKHIKVLVEFSALWAKEFLVGIRIEVVAGDKATLESDLSTVL